MLTHAICGVSIDGFGEFDYGDRLQDINHDEHIVTLFPQRDYRRCMTA